VPFCSNRPLALVVHYVSLIQTGFHFGQPAGRYYLCRPAVDCVELLQTTSTVNCVELLQTASTGYFLINFSLRS
jgi:hypothetical protein